MEKCAILFTNVVVLQKYNFTKRTRFTRFYYTEKQLHKMQCNVILIKKGRMLIHTTAFLYDLNFNNKFSSGVDAYNKKTH